MKDKVYRDVLLWVGECYYKSIAAFKQEALQRGCCRRAPQAPEWVVPNQSRVFLIHRDGLARNHGRIFGYYVIHRMERIRPPEKAGALVYESPKHRHGSLKLSYCVYDADNGKPISDASVTATFQEQRPLTAIAEDRGVCVMEIPYLVVSFTAVAPGYGARHLQRVRVPTDRQYNLVFYLDHLKQRPEIKVEFQKGVTPVFADSVFFEPQRGCGYRADPNGVYLVDRKTAEVTDRLHRALEHMDTRQNYASAANAAGRIQYVREGNVAFARATQSCKEQSGLVLLERPLIFESSPRAHFMGIRRIDGQEIMDALEQNRHIVHLTYPPVGLHRAG